MKQTKIILLVIVGAVVFYYISLFLLGKNAQGQLSPISFFTSGGQNSGMGRYTVKKEQAILFENLWYDNLGEPSKRPGFSVFNTNPGNKDTSNVTAVYATDLIGFQRILVVTGDSAGADSEVVGRLALAVEATNSYDTTEMSDIPPGNQYDFVTMKDTVFIASGGAPTISYYDTKPTSSTRDGIATWTEHLAPGVPTPSPIGDPGSGNLTGVFIYALGYSNGDVMGPPSEPIRAVGQDVKVGNLQRSSAGVSRVLYRLDIGNLSISGSDTSDYDSVAIISDTDLTFWIDRNGSDPTINGRTPNTYANKANATSWNSDHQPGLPRRISTVAQGGAGQPVGCYAIGLSWFNGKGDTTPIMSVVGFEKETLNEYILYKGFPKHPIRALNMDSVIVWRTKSSVCVGDTWEPGDTTFYVARSVPMLGEDDTLHDSALDAALTVAYTGGNTYGSIHATGVPPLKATRFYIQPNAAYIEEHHQQLWVVPYDSMRSVFFSEIGILDSFPVSNELVFPDIDSDSCTGLKSVSDVMLVFFNRAIFRVAGVDRFDIIQFKTNQPIGCAAPGSIQVWNEVVYFVGQDGVYRMTATSPPEKVSEPIADLIDAASDAAKADARAIITDEGRYFLSFNGQLLVHDIIADSWSAWDFDASSFTYAQFDGSRELLFGSVDGDSVYVFNTGDTAILDTGTEITSKLRLPFIQSRDMQTQIVKFGLDMTGTGNSGDSLLVNFYDEADSLVDSQTYATNLSTYQLFMAPTGAIGNSISMEIHDNRFHDTLTIHRVDVFTRTRGRRVY